MNRRMTTKRGSGFLRSCLFAGIAFLAGILIACGTDNGSGSDLSNVTQVFASGWEPEEGIRISDPYAWNPDIVSVPGGYRMYFEQEASSGEHNIYSYFSADGLTWDQDGGIRVAGANMVGSVKLPDGTVRLYFKSAGIVATDGLLSAVSDDVNGLDFTLDEGIRLSLDAEDEEGGIRHPCVVRLPDDTYQIFYDATDADEVYRIKTATSSDGLTWENKRVAVQPSDVMALGTPVLDVTSSPGAVVDGQGLIRVFFTVRGPNQLSIRKGMYMATSTDGTTFTVLPGPIASEFSVDGSAYSPCDAAPVFTPEGLRVYYWVGSVDTGPLTGIYSMINRSITQ
jgi:hypothetical protein